MKKYVLERFFTKKLKDVLTSYNMSSNIASLLPDL